MVIYILSMVLFTYYDNLAGDDFS